MTPQQHRLDVLFGYTTVRPEPVRLFIDSTVPSTWANLAAFVWWLIRSSW